MLEPRTIARSIVHGASWIESLFGRMLEIGEHCLIGRALLGRTDLAGCAIAAVAYFPLFGALTHYANPALGVAIQKALSLPRRHGAA
jgi:hypothetical protein